VKCIKLAIEHPPALYERVQIFNQATENAYCATLAEKIAAKTGVKIVQLANPRIEARKTTFAFPTKNS